MSQGGEASVWVPPYKSRRVIKGSFEMVEIVLGLHYMCIKGNQRQSQSGEVCAWISL